MRLSGLFRRAPIVAVACLLAFQSLPPVATARAETAGATFVVNTVTDFPDPVPGNGVCEVTGSPTSCTLRAAIQEANAWPGDDIITFSPSIPTPAAFNLTRVGADNTALNGDLDITGNLTIQGRGAAQTIVNGSSISDRISTCSV